MYKKLLTMMGTLALLGLTAGQAQAITISILPSTSIAGPGDTVTVDLVAVASFAGETTIGGNFAISWDVPGLQLVPGSASVDTSWVSGPITENASSISVNVTDLFYLALGTPRALDLVTPTSIATLSFIYAGGPAANITGLDDPNAVNPGWFTVDQAGNSQSITSSYESGIVTSPVPVPAAAWLMLSGLLGLVGVARRKGA